MVSILLPLKFSTFVSSPLVPLYLCSRVPLASVRERRKRWCSRGHRNSTPLAVQDARAMRPRLRGRSALHSLAATSSLPGSGRFSSRILGGCAATFRGVACGEANVEMSQALPQPPKSQPEERKSCRPALDVSAGGREIIGHTPQITESHSSQTFQGLGNSKQ